MQQRWVDVDLPEIQELAQEENGIVMYEDEVSIKVSGTLSRTWGEKGRNRGSVIKSQANMKSVKAFGATTAERNPKFHFLFKDIFNGENFLKFLKQIVRQHERKIHLVLDNARFHHAKLLKDWLEKNSKKIQLHFLPPYSPELNAQEGVWRLTRRLSTHNRFFKDEKELKEILFRRFNRFQGNPASLRKMMTPFVEKV